MNRDKNSIHMDGEKRINKDLFFIHSIITFHFFCSCSSISEEGTLKKEINKGLIRSG